MNELKRWRLQRGLSLRKLASMANVDQSTISRLEQGHHLAQETTIKKLEQALALDDGALNSLVDRGASERGRRGGLASKNSPKDIPAPTHHSQAGMHEKAGVTAPALSVSY